MAVCKIIFEDEEEHIRFTMENVLSDNMTPAQITAFDVFKLFRGLIELKIKPKQDNQEPAN